MSKFSSLVTGLAAALVVLGATQATAEAVKPDAVKIVDAELATSLTGAAGNAENGRKWFKNRKLGNCLACHKNSDMKKEQFHGEVGPEMDGVAGRYEAAQLRAILVNSKQVFGPDSIMPSFYRTSGFNRTNKKFIGKSILNAQQVEDILAYLLTLK